MTLQVKAKALKPPAVTMFHVDKRGLTGSLEDIQWKGQDRTAFCDIVPFHWDHYKGE